MAGGMTRRMSRPTHGGPPNRGDLPIKIGWQGEQLSAGSARPDPGGLAGGAAACPGPVITRPG
jgi:hypothetical protein